MTATAISTRRLVDSDDETVGRSLILPRFTPTLVLEAVEARIQEPDDTDWFDRGARAFPQVD